MTIRTKPLSKIAKEKNTKKPGKNEELKRAQIHRMIADKLPVTDRINPTFNSLGSDQSLFFIKLNLRYVCSPLTNKLYKKSGRALTYSHQRDRQAPYAQTSNTLRLYGKCLTCYPCAYI